MCLFARRLLADQTKYCAHHAQQAVGMSPHITIALNARSTHKLQCLLDAQRKTPAYTHIYALRLVLLMHDAIVQVTTFGPFGPTFSLWKWMERHLRMLTASSVKAVRDVVTTLWCIINRTYQHEPLAGATVADAVLHRRHEHRKRPGCHQNSS